MIILSLTDVDKTVGNGLLFEDVTIGIEEGEKIGLVGRNGSGKSTLLRLLTGALEPDEGSITRARALRIATLDQRPQPVPGLTVDDFLLAHASPPLDHEEQIAATHRYRAVCTQLGIEETGQQLSTLSGGMLKKVAVARCMAFDSDLLTLDEPTNHLDLDAIIWLEARLKAMTGGFIMVTHDRAILDSVCTTILEISDQRVYRHVGNYSAYLRRRSERQAEQDASEQRRITILRRELEWLARGPRARTGKDKGRKARAEALMDAAAEPEVVMGRLPAAERRIGKKVLEVNDVAKSYSGAPVISGFSYIFSPGERVGVIGPNGSGKTTLLDMIARRVTPDRGSVDPGETISFAYFDQTAATLDGSMTVLDYLKDEAERVRVNADTTISVEKFLERFLFPRPMFAQPLERLSGGELRRLYLVRLLATAPNFLLLDEPTNDLDIDTLRVLENYLEEFAGCLLMVSHDRALLNRLTDSLLIFDGSGGIRSFVGSYDDYREERADAERRARESASSGRGRAEPASPAKAVDRRDRRGLSFREQREYDRLPDEIETDEQEIKRLEGSFQLSSHNPDELTENTKRYHALREEIEQKTARWEELAERLDE